MSPQKLLPITKYLIEFLNTHISHKLAHFQKTRFSTASNQILSALFDKMILAESEFSINNILKGGSKTIKKGNDYELIDERIKILIDQSNFVSNTYGFSIGLHNIEVHILSDKNIDDSYIKKIYIWLCVALSFSLRKCSQELSIFIYLTELEKEVPEKHSAIEQINVNTGFTFPCKSKNEINVYRKEEWFKVLIHETFHNLGLDFSHYDCSNIDEKVLTIFPVNSEVRLCETYCETWAEILNVMFIVFNPNTSTETLVKKTEKHMDLERTFSLFQAAKVLKHFGITYKQLYERNESAHMVRKMRYKENTPVLSYYIIKSLLMYKINNFLEWCVSNNGISIRFGNLNSNMEITLNNYFELIRETHSDKIYNDCLDTLFEWFTKQEKTRRKEDTEFTTLRMSLFET